jgi:hypothetical protein
MGPVLGLIDAGASPVITSNCWGPQSGREKVMVVTPASTAKVCFSTSFWGQGQNRLLGIEYTTAVTGSHSACLAVMVTV